MVQVQEIKTHVVLRAILKNFGRVNGSNKVVVAQVNGEDYYQVVDEKDNLLAGFSLEYAIEETGTSVHLKHYKAGTLRQFLSSISFVHKVFTDIKESLNADKISVSTKHRMLRLYFKKILKMRQDNDLFYQ